MEIITFAEISTGGKSCRGKVFILDGIGLGLALSLSISYISEFCFHIFYTHSLVFLSVLLSPLIAGKELIKTHTTKNMIYTDTHIKQLQYD